MRYNECRVASDQENERYLTEQHQVKNLRKKKTEVTKRKELSEKECQKLSNELQAKIIHRKELEAMALKLTSQLETCVSEKEQFLTEHDKNQVSPRLPSKVGLATDRRVQLRGKGPQAGAGPHARRHPDHLRRGPDAQHDERLRHSQERELASGLMNLIVTFLIAIKNETETQHISSTPIRRYCPP